MKLLFALLAAAAAVIEAQPSVKVQQAELSVPFGVAPGQLALVGDYLVFIDSEKPEASMAALRSGIRDISVAAELVTVDTAAPLADRSGARSRFVFRLKNAAGAEDFLAWFKSAPFAGAAKPAPAGSDKAAAEPAAAVTTYQATHKHRIGGCTGRLIVEDGRLVYESIDDVEHSRRWALSEIKELKRNNPYALKVNSFSGDNYDFTLPGQGMDTPDFKAIVDRVTRARSR